MAAYAPIYTTVAGVQAKTGLTNSEVDLTNADVLAATVEDAEIELELLCGRKFTTANTVTEYFSIRGSDVIGNYQSNIVLSNFPLQGITEFKVLDSAGTAIYTFATLTSPAIDTVDYWCETQYTPLTNTSLPNGRIILKNKTFPKGINNVKVIYTYGFTTVPVAVRDLATCLAGIRCWIRFMGGQYNRFNSYSIPQQNVDKGDFYQRGRQNIEQLQAEANQLLDRIGRKLRTSLYATGGDR